MKKNTEIKRGQAISFRVPSDTPDHLLKQLQRLKETERRNFSSKIADFVMQGVGYSFTRERESITIPLPHNLSKSQRDWLKHEHSEALLGSIIYHLLTDPIRATTLLASLNSNALDINEALYLQEEITTEKQPANVVGDGRNGDSTKEIALTNEKDPLDDDINKFDWEEAKEKHPSSTEDEMNEVEDDLSGLLGDFLTKMNK